MAELATIARPYAEALFKSAQADLDATSGWLEPLALIAADAQLQAFASNPKASDQQVLDLIAGAVQVALPAHGQNFLRTVIENGRLSALPEMAAQFRALKNAQRGTSDAVVYSAFALDNAALADLSAVLERRFGRKLHLTVQIDASLIGGVRVVVGDEVLDTSVQARLEQMKVALAA